MSLMKAHVRACRTEAGLRGCRENGVNCGPNDTVSGTPLTIAELNAMTCTAFSNGPGERHSCTTRPLEELWSPPSFGRHPSRSHSTVCPQEEHYEACSTEASLKQCAEVACADDHDFISQQRLSTLDKRRKSRCIAFPRDRGGRIYDCTLTPLRDIWGTTGFGKHQGTTLCPHALQRYHNTAWYIEQAELVHLQASIDMWKATARDIVNLVGEARGILEDEYGWPGLNLFISFWHMVEQLTAFSKVNSVNLNASFYAQMKTFHRRFKTLFPTSKLVWVTFERNKSAALGELPNAYFRLGQAMEEIFHKCAELTMSTEHVMTPEEISIQALETEFRQKIE